MLGEAILGSTALRAMAFWADRCAGHHQYLLNAARKRARLRQFGCSRETLPTATISLATECDCASCSARATQVYDHLATFWLTGGGLWAAASFRPTLAILDLARFPDFAAYARSVSKACGDSINRSVRNARRAGFHTHRIATDSHSRSLASIKESKLWRANGLVIDACLPTSHRLIDSRRPYQTPACRHSWTMEWAAFCPAGGDRQLVAFVQLRRVGTYIAIDHLIGHGRFLRKGVVKLLLFDVIEWLLRREDPLVSGLRFLHYGKIESDNHATLRWRRHMQFRPSAADVRRPVNRQTSMDDGSTSGLSRDMPHASTERPGGERTRVGALEASHSTSKTVMPNRAPTVCLCMVVGRASPAIDRCLASVLPLIDRWVVVDAGASAATRDLIRATLAGKRGFLVRRPHRDESNRRSEALSLAGEHADFLLVIDADDRLETPAGYRLPDLTADRYTVDVRREGRRSRRPLIVRARQAWRVEGATRMELMRDGPQTSEHLPIRLVCDSTLDAAMEAPPSLPGADGMEDESEIAVRRSSGAEGLSERPDVGDLLPMGLGPQRPTTTDDLRD